MNTAPSEKLLGIQKTIIQQSSSGPLPNIGI